MATIKTLDDLIGKYNRAIPLPAMRNVVQWSLDARRLLIFGKRAAGGVLIGTSAPDTNNQPEIEKAREDIEKKQSGAKPVNNISAHSFKTTEGAEIVNDYIAIIDIDFLGYNKGTNVIKLPFIPRELAYNCDSTFVAIKPMGRNNPKYHFVGSEDKLEFEIDWHSFLQTRDDVITKCRMIEALSKADGYSNPPHRVLLQWGSNNILFREHVFVVLSAPYRLTHFNKAQISQATGKIELTNMMPIQAYQKVTLARITSANLTKREIEYVGYKASTSNLRTWI